MKSDSMTGHHRRGLSMTEVLVTVGLVVLLFGALISLYGGYRNIFHLQQTSFTTGTSASRAMVALEAAVRQASRVLASHTIAGTPYTTGSNTLVLELPAIDAGNTVLSGMFDHVVFFVSGTSLYRVIVAHPSSARVSGTTQFTDTLSALILSYDTATPSDAAQVSILMTFAAESGHAASQLTVEQEVRLRNKQ